MQHVVYAIRNKANGKVYIGSSSRAFGSRKYSHVESLKKGKHYSRELQADWDALGPDAFEFKVVEQVDMSDLLRAIKDRLRAREQYWIDMTRCFDGGYNSSPSARHNGGSRFYRKESFRRKQSEKARRQEFGKHHDPRTATHSINQGRTQADLTDEIAEAIRGAYSAGATQKDLAEKYGVCQQTISNIVRRRGVVYGGISRKAYRGKPRIARISDDVRQRMCELAAAGMTQTAIAKQFGVTQAAVSKIVKNR